MNGCSKVKMDEQTEDRMKPIQNPITICLTDFLTELMKQQLKSKFAMGKSATQFQANLQVKNTFITNICTTEDT